MSATLDTVVQDAKTLRSVMEKYKEELKERGFTEARFALFDDAMNGVLSKHDGQLSAHNALLQRTKEQIAVMKETQSMLSRMQNGAKSAFGKQSVKLKEFRVGSPYPKTVKKMIVTLDYLTQVVQKYRTDLLANGIAEEDVRGLSDAYARLVAADALQENTKKLRAGATQLRDDSVKTLQDQVSRVRSFARASFTADKAKLKEYAPIKAGGKVRTRTAKAAKPAEPPKQ